jgi:uncharacterized protein (DUF433 family)
MTKTVESSGAYTADRAAALSGVPRSTVHYWARHQVLVPSVSPTKVKLWSYPDLMALRTIYWLRQSKITTQGWDIPASTMPAVRRAIRLLRDLDLDLWTEEGGPRVAVDPSGEIFLLRSQDEVEDLHGARPLDRDLLNLIEPFSTKSTSGPDLQKPREHLRIVPGKLSGSPHIAHTRLETITISSLRERGFRQEGIERLYPTVAPVGLLEAIDLEQQLSRNLLAAA